MAANCASADDRAGSPERFGYAWAAAPEVLPLHEEQFERWTAALDPGLWRGARVLDVGCGMGRNSHWALARGAASVLAIDLDERSLEAARRNLAGWPTAEVRRMSAHAIDAENSFDVAMAIGVIHHLDDPDGALRRMTAAVRPGGRVLVWLYGRENNGWIVRLFDPLRRALLARLPLGLVHALSLPATALLWLALHLGWGRLPYHDLLRRLGFAHLRAIVFDHMIPRTATYWRREQALDLLRRAGLDEVEAVWVNRMSWSVVGRKPAAA